MERKAALGKNRESTVIIVLSTDRILPKMKSNDWIKSKRLGISQGGRFALGEEVSVFEKKSKNGWIGERFV